MKLDDAKSAYEALSAKFSDIVRQMSLAGIALVWLFRTGPDKSPAIDHNLMGAALFVVLSLVLDLAQYLVGTVTWFAYFRHKEKQGISNDVEFVAPESLNWPTWILFYLKAMAMAYAYVGYILPFLYRKFAL